MVRPIGGNVPNFRLPLLSLSFCTMMITLTLIFVQWASLSIYLCTLRIIFTFFHNPNDFTFFLHTEHHFHFPWESLSLNFLPNENHFHFLCSQWASLSPFFAQWESLSLSWTENCKYRNLLCSLFALTFQIF